MTLKWFPPGKPFKTSSTRRRNSWLTSSSHPTFTGDPITIDWGIRKAGSTNDFESNGLILSVAKDGTQTVINQGYNGRMNGIRSGKSQSGRVVFTLTNIKMKDIDSYFCMLRAGFGDSNQYDDLKLAVKGNCRCF